MDPINVLIVDDEEDFVEAVVERLRLRGFVAEGATNGHDALELLVRRSFDVVLLDVKMPGLGGLEVIRTIKEKRPALQVVLLTGHGSTQDSEEGMKLGAFKYLMKPVNFDDLTNILRLASKMKQEEEGEGR